MSVAMTQQPDDLRIDFEGVIGKIGCVSKDVNICRDVYALVLQIPCFLTV